MENEWKLSGTGIRVPITKFRQRPQSIDRAATGITTSVDQGPYPWPVAVLVYKFDVPEHLY